MLRRFVVAPRSLAAAIPLTTFASRGVKSSDPTYEDDRWLEAELANKEMTAEERYAFTKQRQAIKDMMAKVAKEAKASAGTAAAAPAQKELSREELEEKVKVLEKTVQVLLKDKH
eukprot:PhF_6_TR42435/c1_g1_i1/m.64002